MSGTAYERIVDLLRERGHVRDSGSEARASCPSCDSHNPTSLAVYRKAGKAKLVCYVGCDEELDILRALGLDWPDKYDDPSDWASRTDYRPDPAAQARIEARRKMSPVERAVDDLLRLPDLGERLCRCIAAEDARRER